MNKRQLIHDLSQVKCDRRFPCANCIKAAVQCVPAALVPRQRRRRFPERDLLDRLRHYESLLQENNISFEPLHGKLSEASTKPGDLNSGVSEHSQTTGHGMPSELEKGSAKGSATGIPEYRPKNFWHAMNRKVSMV